MGDRALTPELEAVLLPLDKEIRDKLRELGITELSQYLAMGDTLPAFQQTFQGLVGISTTAGTVEQNSKALATVVKAGAAWKNAQEKPSAQSSVQGLARDFEELGMSAQERALLYEKARESQQFLLPPPLFQLADVCVARLLREAQSPSLFKVANLSKLRGVYEEAIPKKALRVSSGGSITVEDQEEEEIKAGYLWLLQLKRYFWNQAMIGCSVSVTGSNGVKQPWLTLTEAMDYLAHVEEATVYSPKRVAFSVAARIDEDLRRQWMTEVVRNGMSLGQAMRAAPWRTMFAAVRNHA